MSDSSRRTNRGSLGLRARSRREASPDRTAAVAVPARDERRGRACGRRDPSLYDTRFEPQLYRVSANRSSRSCHRPARTKTARRRRHHWCSGRSGSPCSIPPAGLVRQYHDLAALEIDRTQATDVCIGSPYCSRIGPDAGFGVTRESANSVGRLPTASTPGLKVTLMVWFPVTLWKV